MRGGAVEGGQARLPQEPVELGHGVLLQELHGGDVQRAGQGFRGGHGSFELPAEVLRGEPVDVDGDVRQEGAGQYQPFLQGGVVEDGLQDASGAARGADDVHLAAVGGVAPSGVSAIGGDPVVLQVDDQDGQVAYVAAGKFPAMPFGQRLQAELQGFVHCGDKGLSGVSGG